KPNADLNKYGGWKTGPKLKATGFFRVEKLNNKWWLVDPEGRLFWSHGIDCVHSSAYTPISDRENYYKALPQKDSKLAQFYGRGSWAPHGYYNTHTPYKTYDFFKANLVKKYGDDWQDIFADLAHKRLSHWGLNTIANWSDANIYKMQRTPYTATIHFSAKIIEGSQGYWGKFYDVFDDSFRENMRKKMQQQIDNTANDPWCIGYFVHNEIAWGDDVSLAVATLKSPADQPAKKVFVNDLKAKYKTIKAINTAWNTDHASWKHLLESTAEPDREKAKKDLNEFYKKIADKYFTTIRQELKAIAPNQLYMGCRFSRVNDTAARSAARHCDIVCYNRYHYSVADLALPDKIDKPIIIGEFHFGALDRGMFHTGLKATKDQNDRALKYKEYVRGALKNQYIVGTHWFQY
ncbi:MAG: beta-galactosidase, partial [Anaerohalosphaera sp.]|nr:beta-galactosidase [Anaerohalosphaera sp.]